MVDNTPTKMVTRSISRSDPDARTVPTFDLEISQSEEEDALPSEEVRGIGHKRKVRDDVSTPNNDDDDLVKEGSNVEAAADIPTVPQSSPQHINASCFSVSNKFDSSTVELQRDDNVEAVEDILVVSQPSSQHIGTDRSSNPKQGDTCSVELQQILEENPHQMHTSDDQVIEETESQYEIPDELLPSLKLVKSIIIHPTR